jgi:triphosphoribosyl-dephospho-CoA synthase
MTAAFPFAIARRNSATYSCKSHLLADTAVWALIEEAELTPKPGLVDSRGSGAHNDMSLAMLRCSAIALRPTFLALARASDGQSPDSELRSVLGAIGREGESLMLQATGGCNTHRGAIWTIGLLCAAASTLFRSKWSAATICTRAADLARLPDARVPHVTSHGAMVMKRYGVRGARGEAECGFPHVTEALSVLRFGRMRNVHENASRLNALMASMVTLEDTCLLHRGGTHALHVAQHGARRVLDAGGASRNAGLSALLHLDRELTALNSSPGGSADLLAAALFLDRLTGGEE